MFLVAGCCGEDLDPRAPKATRTSLDPMLRNVELKAFGLTPGSMHYGQILKAGPFFRVLGCLEGLDTSLRYHVRV